MKRFEDAPFGARLLSWVIMIGAVLDLSFATVMVLERNDPDTLAQTGLSSSGLVAYGLTMAALALTALWLGIMLRTGSNVARFLIAGLAVLRLATLLYVVATFDRVHWYSALVPVAIYTWVACYLLFDNDARAYYEDEPELPLH